MKEPQMQQELFEDINAGKKPRLFKKPNLKIREISIVFYNERLVFLVVGVILLCILSFSLGMERAKALILKSQAPPEVLAQQKEPIKSVELAPVLVKNENVKSQEVQMTPEQREVVSGMQEFYTVQVVAYKSKKLAEEEVEKLKKLGLDAFIVPDKNFNLVCVGKFQDRKEAVSTVNKLKKDYRDCFVAKRRMQDVNTP